MSLKTDTKKMSLNKIAQTLLTILAFIVNMICGDLSFTPSENLLRAPNFSTQINQPKIKSVWIGGVLHSEQEK